MFPTCNVSQFVIKLNSSYAVYGLTHKHFTCGPKEQISGPSTARETCLQNALTGASVFHAHNKRPQMKSLFLGCTPSQGRKKVLSVLLGMCIISKIALAPKF